MSLGPFVLVHGRRDFGEDEKGRKRHLFLGTAGWTPNRSQALSFDDARAASEWRAEGEKATPNLFRSNAVSVMRVEYTQDDDEAFLLRRDLHVANQAKANDYDPFEGNR